MTKYSINQIVDVEVTSIRPYGVFVKCDDYIGLIHISEINGKYISDINDYLKIGDIKSARIIEIDDDNKQLKLSTKNITNIPKEKKVNKRLPGTKLGFELFEEILPVWIDEKIQEINKKN